jgi:hypothetical protein
MSERFDEDLRRLHFGGRHIDAALAEIIRSQEGPIIEERNLIGHQLQKKAAEELLSQLEPGQQCCINTPDGPQHIIFEDLGQHPIRGIIVKTSIDGKRQPAKNVISFALELILLD